MREQMIREALDEHAARQLPGHADPWAAILRRHAARLVGERTGRFGGAIRRGALAVALALIVAFATAGAAGVHFRWYQEPQPPRNILVERGLLHEIGQSQTVQGFTVTVRHAYADANLIVVDYTVRDAAGQVRKDVHTIELVLTDASGATLPPILGGWTVDVDPGETGQEMYFDAAGLRDDPATLQLHFSLRLAAYGQGPSSASGASPGATAPNVGAAPGRAKATPTIAASNPYHPIAPPFVFEFAVPFERGMSIQPRQTVTTAGVSLTLQRIVATPSEARATVCFMPPAAGELSWLVEAEMNGRTTKATAIPSGAASERCAALHFAPLPSASADTTIIVREIASQTPDGLNPIRGPWTFRITWPR
jgi:hypothetical protein